MRDLLRTAGAVSLALVIAIGMAACGSGAPEGRGHGVVQAVDTEAREVTLDHEDVPGLMQGMTMTFEVAPDVSLDGIEPGAEVDFRVREEGGVYTLTEIRRSGS